MFTDRQPISYAKFKDGKVLVYRGKNPDGTRKEDAYDYVSGQVTDVYEKENEYKGETIKSWQVVIHDNQDVAILSLGYSSGFTRGFFNSLANADLSAPIRFGCYVKGNEKGEFNCSSLYQNGENIRWKYDEVPKTETVMVGTKKVINDEEAVKWTHKVVDEIKAQLTKPIETPTVPLEEAVPPDYAEKAKSVADIMGGEVMPEPETNLPWEE